MGVMCAVFQSMGIFPWSIHAWKRIENTGDSSVASSFSMKGGIPSGPVALKGLKFFISLQTPSFEMVNDSIEGAGGGNATPVG